MKMNQDSPQVKIPPPLVAIGLIVIGQFLSWVFPMPFISESLQCAVGTFFILGGMLIFISCAVRFRREATGIPPWTPTTKLIVSGYYRFSRNPIYVGFTLVILGIGFITNSMWTALMVIPFVLLLNKLVIAKEEKYLEGKFGQDYLAYKQKVRRWI